MPSKVRSRYSVKINLMRKEIIVFSIILVVAGFFRLYQIDTTPQVTPNLMVITVISAALSLLSVICLYLLTKRMFGWRIAAITAFLMATSFWHVNLARTEIMATSFLLVMISMFYFLWEGFRNHRTLYFIVAGILCGFGPYIYDSFFYAIPVVIILFLGYWSFLQRDFSLSKYEFARHELLKGFTAMGLTALIIFLPLGFLYWTHADMIGDPSTGSGSVFVSESPIVETAKNIEKTLGMFLVSGDRNIKYNIPGRTAIAWPLVIFFAIGLVKEFVHWIKQKHGHFSVAHTMLFSWLILMALPAIFGNNAPNSLLTAGALPVIMILTARGIWWLFEKLNHTEELLHATNHSLFHGRMAPKVSITLFAFLGAIGFFEYWQFFHVWGTSPEVLIFFNQIIK